jgi:hypothetical protein
MDEARIVEEKGVGVVRERPINAFPSWKQTCNTIIEEMLETVFSTRSALRLYIGLVHKFVRFS